MKKFFAIPTRLIFKLVREGKFTGLRIDHVDGLYDPLGYLERLRREAGNFYLTVEKILGFDEDLPAALAGRGHHGLRVSQLRQRDFLRRVAQRRQFSQIYSALPDSRLPVPALMIGKKTADHRQIHGRRYRGPRLSAQDAFRAATATPPTSRFTDSKERWSKCWHFFLSIAVTSAATSFSAQDRRELTHGRRAGQGSQRRLAARIEFYRTIFAARLRRSPHRGRRKPAGPISSCAFSN